MAEPEARLPPPSFTGALVNSFDAEVHQVTEAKLEAQPIPICERPIQDGQTILKYGLLLDARGNAVYPCHGQRPPSFPLIDGPA
jgi:hypothetical protein